MDNGCVHLVGVVTDRDGTQVPVGVDHDAVTIGGRYVLGEAQAEEFAHLLVAAVWEAAQQEARVREASCCCGRSEAACAAAGRGEGHG
jgi:hypothetical protein